jgi:hypothetical protein
MIIVFPDFVHNVSLGSAYQLSDCCRGYLLNGYVHINACTEIILKFNAIVRVRITFLHAEFAHMV